jgi:osmotically inducible protein OsmC
MQRKATAVWTGGLKDGRGVISSDSGVLDETQYSFATRFEHGMGTNPEELIAAAHAGCFSMALSGNLGKAGFAPQEVATTATVHLEKQEPGFTLTRIDLVTQARVDGIDETTLQVIAEQTKDTCPVSRALAAVAEMTVSASLR